MARTYGRGHQAVVAVHEIFCSVAAGSSTAVVGPSGSGKSTLLHLLAGIDDPTVGEITWPGLGGPPRTLRPGTVGLVFQGPSLLPAMDAVENVALPLLLAGAGDAEATKAAMTALERLGVDELAGLLPEELSGGQSQRVAVARALASRPRLLIADEPTGQLDRAAGALVVAALEEAAEATGAALILSTHDPAIASRFQSRWLMSDGALRTELASWSG